MEETAFLGHTFKSVFGHSNVMEATLETVHYDLMKLQKDVEYIKAVLREEFELSDYAKKELREARETPESEYVDLE